MKKATSLITLLILLSACNNFSNEYAKSQEDLASARDSICILQKQIEQLSYPANQRLDNINKLIQEGNFESAQIELKNLVALFPNSKEAQLEPNLKSKIESLRQAKIEEQKRLKALGFKVLKDNMTVSIGDVCAKFNGFKTASTFVFDNDGYEYRYRQADKNCMYISASMNITSSSSNPKLPECAIYFVDGDVLRSSQVRFTTEFARWEDYGSYLGNDADFNNDFSKVNTVKFKIGAEIENEDLKRPFVVILKKEGVLERKMDRYATPAVRYSGHASFPSTLTIEDVDKSGQYVVIKRYNFDKL